MSSFFNSLYFSRNWRFFLAIFFIVILIVLSFVMMTMKATWRWIFVFSSSSFLFMVTLQLFLRSQFLYAARQRLNEAFDLLSLSIMVTNEEGNIIFSNHSYKAKIQPKVNSQMYNNPGNLIEALSFLNEAIRHTNKPIEKILEGEWLKISLYPLTRHKGSVLWIFEDLEFFETVSRHGTVEATDNDLKISQYVHAFHESPIGTAILSEGNKILKVNKSFSLISGYHESALISKNLEDLMVEDSKIIFNSRLKIDPEKLSWQVPIDISLSQIQDKNIDLYLSSLKKDVQGALRVVHFVDNSERKKLEAQFVQSQKMQAIGQLAGGIAHDFNNLLTAMIGFCDLLLLRHVPGDQSFSDIMHIKQNANRAATLVRQLLAFSRQQTMQSRVINLNDAVADLSVLMRRLLGINVEMETHYSSQVLYIKADLGQIEQVLVNLAVNARDAMLQGGILTLKTYSHKVREDFQIGNDMVLRGDYACVEVRDTGIGIPKDILPRIFDPFFSTKPVGKGTGLGLSTVYGIIRQTGGYITVESEINKGSIFRMFLPEYNQEKKISEQVDEVKSQVNPDLTGSSNILLVEDEESVRMFSARALRDKGYQVFEASCGEEALDFIKTTNHKIDLIITDVVMPKIDGPTLVNELCKQNLNFKVIFISGYMEDAFREQLNTEENIHFLLKPFNLRDFALKVKSVLNEKA